MPNKIKTISIRNNTIHRISAISFSMLVFLPVLALAQSSADMTPSLLDQIVPRSNFQGEQPLSVLLNQIFFAGLAIAVVLAIVMIIKGGVQYMTTDAISGKEDGRKGVQAALGGLVLSFASILILNTINPNLTRLSLSFDSLQRPQANEPGGAAGGLQTDQRPQNQQGSSEMPGQAGPPAPPPAGAGSEEEVRAYFARHGISINKNPCPPGVDGVKSGCTSVGGLGQAALTGVVSLKNKSGATIVITGGTEDGHQTHGVGKSIVDLRKSTTLDSYIKNNSTSTSKSGSWTVYHLDGARYMDEGNHWHVTY